MLMQMLALPAEGLQRNHAAWTGDEAGIHNQGSIRSSSNLPQVYVSASTNVQLDANEFVLRKGTEIINNVGIPNLTWPFLDRENTIKNFLPEQPSLGSTMSIGNCNQLQHGKNVQMRAQPSADEVVISQNKKSAFANTDHIRSACPINNENANPCLEGECRISNALQEKIRNTTSSQHTCGPQGVRHYEIHVFSLSDTLHSLHGGLHEKWAPPWDVQFTKLPTVGSSAIKECKSIVGAFDANHAACCDTQQGLTDDLYNIPLRQSHCKGIGDAKFKVQANDYNFRSPPPSCHMRNGKGKSFGLDFPCNFTIDCVNMGTSVTYDVWRCATHHWMLWLPWFYSTSCNWQGTQDLQRVKKSIDARNLENIFASMLYPYYYQYCGRSLNLLHTDVFSVQRDVARIKVSIHATPVSIGCGPMHCRQFLLGLFDHESSQFVAWSLVRLSRCPILCTLGGALVIQPSPHGALPYGSETATKSLRGNFMIFRRFDMFPGQMSDAGMRGQSPVNSLPFDGKFMHSLLSSTVIVACEGCQYVSWTHEHFKKCVKLQKTMGALVTQPSPYCIMRYRSKKITKSLSATLMNPCPPTDVAPTQCDDEETGVEIPTRSWTCSCHFLHLAFVKVGHGTSVSCQFVGGIGICFCECITMPRMKDAFVILPSPYRALRYGMRAATRSFNGVSIAIDQNAESALVPCEVGKNNDGCHVNLPCMRGDFMQSVSSMPGFGVPKHSWRYRKLQRIMSVLDAQPFSYHAMWYGRRRTLIGDQFTCMNSEIPSGLAHLGDKYWVGHVQVFMICCLDLFVVPSRRSRTFDTVPTPVWWCQLVVVIRDGGIHDRHMQNDIICTIQSAKVVYCIFQCRTCASGTSLFSCKRGNSHLHDKQINCQFFQANFCKEVMRVGEAANPGPFVIATFNPTQLLGREEEVASFPDGIWTACETSHTNEAQNVISNRFRNLQVNSLFSKAAERHSDNNGIFRGKAVGAAIMSRFPLQPYPETLDPEANATCRFSDAIIRVKPNLPLYACAIYGPPENNTILADAEKVFVAASRPGVERASIFRGPAVITGDLNRELHEVPFWPLLQRKGWVDCAMLCHQRFGTSLDATCRDRSRKSFILANPILAQLLTACGTVHEQMFDSHPVLQATFDLDASVRYRQVWSLPRSLDDLQFDEQKISSAAIENCQARQCKFHGALVDENADEAIRQFALAFEESAAVACIDEEGRPKTVPHDCWKRCRSKIKKLTPIAAPILKKGGSGDFTVPVCQPSISVRRHVKQLRRIQSLGRQLESFEKSGIENSGIKCQQLWIKICSANGFEKGFQHWILLQFGIFVPTALPTAEYVQAIYLQFQEYVQEEVAQERRARCSFQKMQLLEDIAGGGRTIFRSVRDPTPPPPSFISFSRCQKVQKQRWKKEGNHRILYQGQCILEAGLPVKFQGQSVMLEKADDKFLYVSPPLTCRDCQDLNIHQDCHTADPQEMQYHVATAWSEMWQCPESDVDEKEKIAEFITTLNDCPSCPYKPFCIAEWKKMMRGVKCRSSRGACGFSMLDVKRMPEVLLKWLFCLYRAVEGGMDWPRRLTLARVAMLAKPGESSHRPLGIRPITILSVLYRLWSRFRSLQVLEFLGQNVPPQVGGIASKLSADALSAWVGDIIDVAHHSDEHICGLVIDLQKCFNLVPRWPLRQLMLRLGIPLEYITAHLAMLDKLTRHIEIAGQIGNEVPSTCGIPEGCAASVSCMVALTVLAAHVMQQVSPTVQVSMFADNWAVITQAIQILQMVVQKLESFVHCLGMKLAPSKSWLWGTSSELRKGLRGVTMSGQPVPIKNSAKDLGCDINYTKQMTKKTSLGRLQKSLRVLRRVKQKKIPRNFLGRMCTAVGVGIVSYCSEMVRFTNKQFHSLRCAIASSLGLYKSGANTLLAIGATGLTVGPQVRLLRRRIKFFRKFFKFFPSRKQSFLHRITKHVSKNRVSGIAAHFHCAMRDAGWKCEEDAVIVHASGLKCNWVEDSIPYLFQCIDKAWEATITTRIDRKGFDLEVLSAKGFNDAIKHRGPQQQGLLTAIASGKHVTRDALAHYAKGDPTCPFCSAIDGKEHRVFHCQGLQDLRAKHREAIKWVTSQPKAVMFFGLAPDNCDAVKLRQQVFCEGFQFLLPEVDSHGVVYTDGTCFNNTSWEHAVAGSAVIQVTGEYQWQLVARKALPTPDHSSYRGEGFAVVLALQNFWKVHIHSDCAAVVDEVQHMLLNHALGVNIVAKSHPDIWNVVAWHIQQRQPGDVKITKVKAHVEWQLLDQGAERQRAFFNAMVDLEAKKSVAADNFELWQKFERMFEHKKSVLRGLIKYHDFLWNVYERSFNIQPRQKPCDVQPSFAELWRFHGSGKIVPAPCQQDLDNCPFGKKFAMRVLAWWNQIQWFEGSPVSVLEVYFDYCFESCSQMPVRMADNSWKLREDSVEADVSPLRLGLQNHAWLRFLRWWFNCIQCPELQIVRSNAMFTYGPTITTWSINLRPRLLHGERVSSEIWQYLHSGGTTARNFKKPWNVLSSKTEQPR